MFKGVHRFSFVSYVFRKSLRKRRSGRAATPFLKKGEGSNDSYWFQPPTLIINSFQIRSSFNSSGVNTRKVV